MGISTYLRVAVGGGVGTFGACGGPWGQGLKSLNFEHFQGPEHVKHEGFGLSGVENSMKNERRKRVKYSIFASRTTFSLGLATLLTLKTQPNRAKTSFCEREPKHYILHAVFIEFYLNFQAPEGRNPRVLRVPAPGNHENS